MCQPVSDLFAYIFLTISITPVPFSVIRYEPRLPVFLYEAGIRQLVKVVQEMAACKASDLPQLLVGPVARRQAFQHREPGLMGQWLDNLGHGQVVRQLAEIDA
jgi:hypothetical protein